MNTENGCPQDKENVMKIGKRIITLLLAAVCAAAAYGTALAGEEFTVAEIAMPQQPVADNDALVFTKGLKAGWNLGNTFDAADCSWLSDPLLYESAWCGVRTQPELFDTLAAAGFAAVRIPVSWHNHVSGDDFTIDPQWLGRVQEVAGYALERGLYVIINTHHDIDPEYLYPDKEHLESSTQYLKSIWSQLASAFAGADERLIFESMNEPRLKGTNVEWYLSPRDARCREAVECINTLNQVFVDTVRAAGGQNAARYLMVPGYDASLDGATDRDFALPQDSAENRIIVSVHAYTPYAFALQDSAQSTFDVNSRKDQSDIDTLMRRLYQAYVANGIPVVLGEYGARDKNGNRQARADFTAYYVAAATAHGIPCFVWDNNAFTGSGELFGLLDRKTLAFAYPEIVKSIMAYAP